MRAGPVLLELGGGLLGDLADGEAGGVGGDDGAGAAMGGDAFEEAALDVEIFRYGFDDPIGFGAAGEIVFEISDQVMPCAAVSGVKNAAGRLIAARLPGRCGRCDCERADR